MQNKYNIYSPPFFPGSDEPAPKILFVQHFNLLCDERIKAWEEAINETVSEDDVVVELGSGTGILSMFAARRARRVWAVELDPHLVEYSRYVINKNGFSDKVQVICSDARNATIPEKADVLICEMLDTGLIKEQLIQVLNEACKSMIHKKTRIIPSKVFTSAVLSHTDFNFSGLYIPLPHFETMEVRKTERFFSKPVLYHVIDLYNRNSTSVDADLNIQVTRTGEVNSIKILTEVELCRGKICSPSHWFNPPLVLPVEPLKVIKGDNLHLKMSYHLGGGLKSMDYRLRRI